MTNRIAESAKRKRAILERAYTTIRDEDGENPIELGVSMNVKWCFALTTEPAVKALVKDKYLELRPNGMWRKGNHKTITMGYITETGKLYLKKLQSMKDNNKKYNN